MKQCSVKSNVANARSERLIFTPFAFARGQKQITAERIGTKQDEIGDILLQFGVPPPPTSDHQESFIFRCGDPELNLYLPLESWARFGTLDIQDACSDNMFGDVWTATIIFESLIEYCISQFSEVSIKKFPGNLICLENQWLTKISF